MSDTDRTPHAVAAGELATGVLHEIAMPLRELRQSLALMIDDLDRHATESGGPVPLPYPKLEALRQQLADSYLSCRTISRLVGDLALATGAEAAATEAVDVNEDIESALAVVKHRVASGTELFVDLGAVPPLRVPAGAVVLAVAAQLVVAATSAGGSPSAAISVRSRRIDGTVVVTVADNGSGVASATALAAADALGHDLADRLGGTFAATCEPGAGAAFELRVPTRGGAG